MSQLHEETDLFRTWTFPTFYLKSLYYMFHYLNYLYDISDRRSWPRTRRHLVPLIRKFRGLSRVGGGGLDEFTNIIASYGCF